MYTVSRFVVVIFLIVCSGSLCYGQWTAGFEAGVAWNRLLTNTENEPNWSYVKGTSFCIGVPVRYAFGRHLSVAGDLQLLQKNYQVNYGRDSFGRLYEAVSNGYLQLPLSIAYSIQCGSVSVSVEGGGFLGYWLHSYVDGSAEGLFNPIYAGTNVAVDQSYSFSSKADRRLEGGWELGGQFGYPVSDRVDVFFAYQFCQSLTSQQKNYMSEETNRYNRTNIVTFRAMYRLPTQKRNRK